MKSQSGYTVVELLTVLAIFGTVTGALTGLFVSATEAEIQTNRRFQAQQNARLALDKLRREVHCASTASVTGSYHVTLTLPNATCRGYPTVSWCVLGSGSRFGLYRMAGATCTTAGTKFVDYLTSNAAFTYTSPTTEMLATLSVSFPVNIKGLAEPEESYTLQDKLTLRNSSRLM